MDRQISTTRTDPDPGATATTRRGWDTPGQEELGPDRIGALMTTTQASLERVEAIVDEYLRLDLEGIFLRPLSPYGFAIKTKQFGKYDAAEWLNFYERGLRYILDINRRGHISRSSMRRCYSSGC